MSTPGSPIRSPRGRVIVVGADTPTASGMRPVVRADNLFDALGEVTVATAGNPVAAVLVPLEVAVQTPGDPAAAFRRVDPAVRLVLVADSEASNPPPRRSTGGRGGTPSAGHRSPPPDRATASRPTGRGDHQRRWVPARRGRPGVPRARPGAPRGSVGRHRSGRGDPRPRPRCPRHGAGAGPAADRLDRPEADRVRPGVRRRGSPLGSSGLRPAHLAPN